MIHEIGHWIETHIHIPGLPVWASVLVIAVVMAGISVALTALALVFIPEDYFTEEALHRRPQYRHPILRWSFRILHNVVGWFLILLGIVLSFPGVPGQGLLTILLGVMLAEFPGKRRLEMKIIHLPNVRSAVDRFRAKFGRPPLRVDGDSAPPANASDRPAPGRPDVS